MKFRSLGTLASIAAALAALVAHDSQAARPAF